MVTIGEVNAVMATINDTKPVINESALVRRTLVPSVDSNAGNCQTCLERLSVLPGVVSVIASLRNRKIHLHYDATQLNIDGVLQIMRELGCEHRQRWIDRLRITRYRYVDENARKNAEFSGGACCSTPTAVYTSQHKK